MIRGGVIWGSRWRLPPRPRSVRDRRPRVGPPDATCSSRVRGPRERSGCAGASVAAAASPDFLRPRPPRRPRRFDVPVSAPSSPEDAAGDAAASGWASSRWLAGVCEGSRVAPLRLPLPRPPWRRRCSASSPSCPWPVLCPWLRQSRRCGARSFRGRRRPTRPSRRTNRTRIRHLGHGLLGHGRRGCVCASTLSPWTRRPRRTASAVPTGPRPRRPWAVPGRRPSAAWASAPSVPCLLLALSPGRGSCSSAPAPPGSAPAAPPVRARGRASPVRPTGRSAVGRSGGGRSLPAPVAQRLRSLDPFVTPFARSEGAIRIQHRRLRGRGLARWMFRRPRSGTCRLRG